MERIPVRTHVKRASFNTLAVKIANTGDLFVDTRFVKLPRRLSSDRSYVWPVALTSLQVVRLLVSDQPLSADLSVELEQTFDAIGYPGITPYYYIQGPFTVFESAVYTFNVKNPPDLKYTTRFQAHNGKGVEWLSLSPDRYVGPLPSDLIVNVCMFGENR